MLNLFSYSGAFGVYAAAGGAASVDERRHLRAGDRDWRGENHALNGFTGEHLVADAFQYVRSRHERFDLLSAIRPHSPSPRRSRPRRARLQGRQPLRHAQLSRRAALMMTFSCSGHMSLDLFQKVIFAAASTPDGGCRSCGA